MTAEENKKESKTKIAKVNSAKINPAKINPAKAESTEQDLEKSIAELQEMVQILFDETKVLYESHKELQNEIEIISRVLGVNIHFM